MTGSKNSASARLTPGFDCRLPIFSVPIALAGGNPVILGGWETSVPEPRDCVLPEFPPRFRSDHPCRAAR